MLNDYPQRALTFSWVLSENLTSTFPECFAEGPPCIWRFHILCNTSDDWDCMVPQTEVAVCLSSSLFLHIGYWHRPGIFSVNTNIQGATWVLIAWEYPLQQSKSTRIIFLTHVGFIDATPKYVTTPNAVSPYCTCGLLLRHPVTQRGQSPEWRIICVQFSLSQWCKFFFFDLAQHKSQCIIGFTI